MDRRDSGSRISLRGRLGLLVAGLALLVLVGAGLADWIIDRDGNRTGREVAVVVAASTLTAAVGATLAMKLLDRWVSRPLAQIGAAARALGTDEGAPLPHFDSSELVDVTHAIRSLQSSLLTSRDEALTALRALEQSAVLALHVRSELADELGEMPDGWLIDSRLVPAEGVVAGDCFDVGLLDPRHLYLVMIDVMGHGPTAALNALKAKSQLRAALRSRLAPGAALDWLAREHRRDERADLLTAVVMVVNIETGESRYATAGHPPPLTTDGRTIAELQRTGPLVGAFAASWSTGVTVIEPGALVLLHTDGITEAAGPGRERFGEQRLHAQLLRQPGDDSELDPADVIERVYAAVNEFREGPRTDDATAIALLRCPVPTGATDDDQLTGVATGPLSASAPPSG